MSEQLTISFDEARRLAVIMRDQQVPEPIEGHPGLCWIEGILTTQDDDPELIKEVNIASVKAAANLYLNENNFIKLILLPE